MTVVETVRFLKDASDLMPESERIRLVEFISANPEAGDLIPDTGGVRKLLWALPMPEGEEQNDKSEKSL